MIPKRCCCSSVASERIPSPWTCSTPCRPCRRSPLRSLRSITSSHANELRNGMERNGRANQPAPGQSGVVRRRLSVLFLSFISPPHALWRRFSCVLVSFFLHRPVVLFLRLVLSGFSPILHPLATFSITLLVRNRWPACPALAPREQARKSWRSKTQRLESAESAK